MQPSLASGERADPGDHRGLLVRRAWVRMRCVSDRHDIRVVLPAIERCAYPHAAEPNTAAAQKGRDRAGDRGFVLYSCSGAVSMPKVLTSRRPLIIALMQRFILAEMSGPVRSYPNWRAVS